MADHKVSAEVGYRNFLISQYEALASIANLEDDTFQWCFVVVGRTGIPQQSLAEKIGVTQPTVSRWSRGDNLPKNQLVRQAYVTELMSYFADYIVAVGGQRPKSKFVFRPASKRGSELVQAVMTD